MAEGVRKTVEYIHTREIIKMSKTFDRLLQINQSINQYHNFETYVLTHA